MFKILLLLTLIPSVALAQDVLDPAAPVVTDDLIRLGEAFVGAVGNASSAGGLMAIMAAIAVGLRLLIGVVRYAKPGFLSATQIRWVTLVAAPVVGFLSAIAAGEHWFSALVVAAGGPGALLINELERTVAPKKKKHVSEDS